MSDIGLLFLNLTETQRQELVERLVESQGYVRMIERIVKVAKKDRSATAYTIPKWGERWLKFWQVCLAGARAVVRRNTEDVE